MPNFLNKLTDLADTEEGALIEFLLQYKFDEEKFHFFFEGYEDPSFYNGFIKSLISQQFFHYIANGKYKLYNLYNGINWDKFNKNRVLFFVDRDYTELIGEELLKSENIYNTDFYSIENQLVCKDILERCLMEILHISNRTLIDEILNKFELEYDKFFKALLYLIAWILFMKRHSVKIVLNDIDLSVLFKFTESVDFKAKGGKQTSYIEKIAGAKTPPDAWKGILVIIREVKSYNPKLVIRGKFEVWFFINFLNRYKEYLASRNIIVNQKTQLTISNFIEICAPRLTIPVSLKSFLEFNVSKVSQAK